MWHQPVRNRPSIALVAVGYVFGLFLCTPIFPAIAADPSNEKADSPTRIELIDMALARAARYLVKKQADDGAWYSETYGGPARRAYAHTLRDE